MAIVNMVTTLFPSQGSVLTDSVIQAHIDSQNANGYYLIEVNNMVGWYRFFWAKDNGV